MTTYIFPFNYQRESSYSDEQESYEEELKWWQNEEPHEADGKNRHHQNRDGKRMNF